MIKRFFLLSLFLSIVVLYAPPAMAQASMPITAADLYEKNVRLMCWTCPAVSSFYEASVVLGYMFSQRIVPYVRELLGVVMGLWILWQVLKIMAPFGPMGGVTEVWNKIAGKLALFIFLMVFLSNTGFGLFWSWIVNPIYVTGVNLSTTMLEATQDATADTSLFTGVIGEANCDWRAEDFPKITSTLVNVDNVGEIVSAGQKVLCMVNDVQKIMGVGVAMGLTAAFFAAGDIKAPYTNVKIAGGRILPEINIPVPDIGGFINSLTKLLLMFSAGIFLAVIYLIALLLYPIYLIDALFKLSIIIVISPILIASYLFEITRGWATTAVKTLVGVAATLLFQSVIIGVSIAMISVTISKGLGGVTSGSGGAGMTPLAYMLSQSGVQSMFAIADGVMTIWFGFLAAGFLVLFMMGSATKMAQAFTGAAASGMASGLINGAIGAGVAIATAGAGFAISSAAAGMMSKGGGTAPAGGAPPAPMPFGSGTIMCPGLDSTMGTGVVTAGAGGSPVAPQGVFNPSNFVSSSGGGTSSSGGSKIVGPNTQFTAEDMRFFNSLRPPSSPNGDQEPT